MRHIAEIYIKAKAKRKRSALWTRSRPCNQKHERPSALDVALVQYCRVPPARKGSVNTQPTLAWLQKRQVKLQNALVTQTPRKKYENMACSPSSAPPNPHHPLHSTRAKSKSHSRSPP